MAYKKRHQPGPDTNETSFVLMLEHVEMLKLEKLLKFLNEGVDADGLGSEENEWLSNALDFFAPELPPGEYPI